MYSRATAAGSIILRQRWGVTLWHSLDLFLIITNWIGWWLQTTYLALSAEIDGWSAYGISFSWGICSVFLNLKLVKGPRLFSEWDKCGCKSLHFLPPVELFLWGRFLWNHRLDHLMEFWWGVVKLYSVVQLPVFWMLPGEMILRSEIISTPVSNSPPHWCVRQLGRVGYNRNTVAIKFLAKLWFLQLGKSPQAE